MSQQETSKDMHGDGHEHPEGAQAHALGAVMNMVRSVSWGQGTSGTLSIATAPRRPCSSFIASGILFQIQTTVGATSFPFTYHGPKTRTVLQQILRPGTNILLQ